MKLRKCEIDFTVKFQSRLFVIGEIFVFFFFFHDLFVEIYDKVSSTMTIYL